MKPEMKELIRTEQRRSDFSFIVEVIQRGRIKPAKYIHNITMPVTLYEEMRDRGIINMEDYYIDEQCFFENKRDEVILNFINLYACEDLHRRIDCFLIVKLLGYYPIKRSGVSKMNFDKGLRNYKV
jgi:hypothetical protein